MEFIWWNSTIILDVCISLKWTLLKCQLSSRRVSFLKQMCKWRGWLHSYLTARDQNCERTGIHLITPPPATLDPLAAGSGTHSWMLGSINSHPLSVCFMAPVGWLHLSTKIRGMDGLKVRKNWCLPQCAERVTMPCVYHSLSLLRCMNAPCRHSHHTARYLWRNLLTRALFWKSWWYKCFQKVAHRCFHAKAITHTVTLRLIWGDVQRRVLSSHLQSFSVCLLWHDIDIVLSTLIPWTCLWVTLQSSHLSLAGRRGGRV